MSKSYTPSQLRGLETDFPDFDYRRGYEAGFIHAQNLFHKTYYSGYKRCAEIMNIVHDYTVKCVMPWSRNEARASLNQFSVQPWGKVRRLVESRDRACVRCGSCGTLECHHILPVSLGGFATERNLQMLCKECHREVSP